MRVEVTEEEARVVRGILERESDPIIAMYDISWAELASLVAKFEWVADAPKQPVQPEESELKQMIEERLMRLYQWAGRRDDVPAMDAYNAALEVVEYAARELKERRSNDHGTR